MSQPVYRRAADLIEADVGDELVALDVKAGEYFSFNPIARSVWHRLSTPQSFDDLRGGLLGEYDVSVQQCARDLEQLLDDMVAEGLIEQMP